MGNTETTTGSKSIFNITAEHFEICQKLEQAAGEITPELEELMKINKGELQSKSMAYHEVMQQKKSFILRIDEEIKRLQALKKRESNVVDRLSSVLLETVQIFGDYTSGLLTFKTRKSETVEIFGFVNDLPAEFKTVKVTEQADKVKIKAHIKAGGSVEGCRLVENKNLSIK